MLMVARNASCFFFYTTGEHDSMENSSKHCGYRVIIMFKLFNIISVPTYTNDNGGYQ